MIHRVNSSYSETVFEDVDNGDDTVEKLRTFRRLADGWHFGAGDRPSDSTLEAAMGLATFGVLNGWETDAFPGVSGEVLLSLLKGNECYEAIFEVGGTITLVTERDDRELDRAEGLHLDDVISRISAQAGSSCSIYASFIPHTGIPVESASFAWPFEIPARRWAEESQSLIVDVLKSEDAPSVRTFRYSTSSSERPLSSGKSTQIFSLSEAA